jgi:hypothetical protein
MPKNISWTISESEAVELTMEEGTPTRMTEALAELEDATHDIVYATEGKVDSGEDAVVVGTVAYWSWHTCVCSIFVQFSPASSATLEQRSHSNEAFLSSLPGEMDDIYSCESEFFDYVLFRQASTKAEATEIAIDSTRKMFLAAKECMQFIPVGNA